MFFTFQDELILHYFRALGCDTEEIEMNFYKELRHVVTKTIEDVSSVIQSRLKIIDTPHQHALNYARRHEIYSTIASYFFEYVYVRCWIFDGHALGTPNTLMPAYSDIFTINPDVKEDSQDEIYWSISNVLKKHSNFFIINLLNTFSDEFLKTIDIQVRQFIFVYCYEHGINLGYF